jgi:hypothetical protein
MAGVVVRESRVSPSGFTRKSRLVIVARSTTRAVTHDGNTKEAMQEPACMTGVVVRESRVSPSGFTSKRGLVIVARPPRGVLG